MAIASVRNATLTRCPSSKGTEHTSRRLLGNSWYQRLDVERTIAVIQRRTGRTIRSWRNHMYMHGPFTHGVLADAGIEVCSDTVSDTALGPTWAAPGLLELPINVIPDHEHLIHAERTPAWIAAWQKRYQWRDAFGSESYRVDAWTDIVLAQLDANEARGALSTIILHPITLYLCDRYRSVRRLLDRIRRSRTVHVSEVATLARARATNEGSWA